MCPTHPLCLFALIRRGNQPPTAVEISSQGIIKSLKAPPKSLELLLWPALVFFFSFSSLGGGGGRCCCCFGRGLGLVLFFLISLVLILCINLHTARRGGREGGVGGGKQETKN